MLLKASISHKESIPNNIAVVEKTNKSNLLMTLIVFDTNSLRSTDAGEVAYSFFAFGKPFQVIEEFIIDKNLIGNIHLAIPTWAIEELKDQKHRQYITDIDEFKKVSKRLLGLPHMPDLTLPEDEFDCLSYIQTKAEEFLATKQIQLLEIKPELANTVLQNMMVRVMKDDNMKKPFANTGKYYKDAGFKDNIIWESLLNYDNIAKYDKIIFLTKDGDYKGCDTEFRRKWNKHITIEKDENSVIVEIERDYALYIAEKEIYEYCQTDYFNDYLFDSLKVKSEININEHNYKIENFEIVDKCNSIERMPPNEDFEEHIIIYSSIKIFFKQGATKKEEVVTSKTTLADDVSLDILDINFEPELS